MHGLALPCLPERSVFWPWREDGKELNSLQRKRGMHCEWTYYTVSLYRVSVWELRVPCSPLSHRWVKEKRGSCHASWAHWGESSWVRSVSTAKPLYPQPFLSHKVKDNLIHIWNKSEKSPYSSVSAWFVCFCWSMQWLNSFWLVVGKISGLQTYSQACMLPTPQLYQLIKEELAYFSF